MQTQSDIYNLEAVNYLASDEAIARMARDYSAARGTLETVRGDYLKVLVAHSQKALPDAVTAASEKVLQVIGFTHERLYALVLGAIITPDIAAADGLPESESHRRALERNRRSNFARTAKSTLVAFVAAGGNLQSLKPGEVTKELLRRVVLAAITPPTPEQRTAKLETSIEDAVRAMAKANREDAIEFIDRLHTRLMLLVATPLTQLTHRRGEITLHPSH